MRKNFWALERRVVFGFRICKYYLPEGKLIPSCEARRDKSLNVPYKF